jgi:segregation and condensation protein A
MAMHQVRLDEFEGPLDLLLFFVRRDELDVHDIPVARIADEYLATVQLAQEVDLDGAADFIYMAALLISIKARLLLPRPELDDDGEPIDPRQELVDRLLEYVRYKEAAERLGERHEARSALFARGHAEPSLEGEADVQYRVSVFELVQALRRVLAEAPEEAYHPVERETFSVEEQRGYLQRVLSAGRTSFVELVSGKSRPFVIATFLAVLDTVQRGAVLLFRGADPGTFFLALPETDPA